MWREGTGVGVGKMCREGKGGGRESVAEREDVKEEVERESQEGRGGARLKVGRNGQM